MADQFDYIIVGAGSAGCVLANRLTACGRYQVCVLEAGPNDWHPFIHIPAGFMKTLVNSKTYQKKFVTQDQLILNFQNSYTKYCDSYYNN